MNLIKKCRITWLSSEKLEKISFGEITNHKTINNRSWKPEFGGLFDPVVFGPFLNYECYCGKYKEKQNKWLTCEQCKVLVAEKNIQRWRMGHIKLASPVTNILIFKAISPLLSKILEIPAKELENIIYFQSYVILDNGLSKVVEKKKTFTKKTGFQWITKVLDEIEEKVKKEIEENEIIKEARELKNEIESDLLKSNIIFFEDYLDFIAEHQKVKVSTGSEALEKLLKKINLQEELIKAEKKKKWNEFRFIKALIKNNIKLESIIVHNVPVIPCGLRPATRLKNEDTVATTQINNLYRKKILINEHTNDYNERNKVHRIFLEDVVNNEKRRLQKAYERLIHISSSKMNENKSLLKVLSGKEGILRRHSLGKRVDYSARSVIVPNPDLSLDQIGIPVKMALILYKFHLIREILSNELAFTVRNAEELLKKNEPKIFPLLNKIIHNYPLLINRAPTLHRLGIQGFYPKLTIGKSLELHPMVTTAFNADFDGDQMTVHLPLTNESCIEIQDNILSSKNIIDPKNGSLITVPSKDMILGIYHLTKEEKNEEMLFYDNLENITRSYEKGNISLHDLIIIPYKLVEKRKEEGNMNKFILTTLGKIMFNKILPNSFIDFLDNLEEEIKKIEINNIEKEWKKHIISDGWKKEEILSFLDKLTKKVEMEEMVIFLDKLKEISFNSVTYSGISISPFELAEEELINKKKIISQAQRKIQEIDIFSGKNINKKDEIEIYQRKIAVWSECKEELEKELISVLERNKKTSFYNIWNSGARVSNENLTQIFAMRGNTINYLGETIETPIISSLWEGLNPHEFFISVYGAIKGITDTALKTAESGYLTRCLVEAGQNIVITSYDCQTDKGILLEEKDEVLSLEKKIYGRFLAQNIKDNNGKIIIPLNTILWDEEIEKIKKENIKSVLVYSVITCESIDGVCQKCYGSDLSKKEREISLGTAVGIIAAQSLGEPGTQLTMRTFHSGGIASEEEDIIQGLPKVKQILDNIKPKDKKKAIIAKDDGTIISIEDKIIRQKINKTKKEITYHTSGQKKLVYEGEKIEKGSKLTSGRIDLEEFLLIMGREKCYSYIKEEIKQVYFSQNIYINEKHIEIFARQMLSKVKIIDNGDSDFVIGDSLHFQQVEKENKILLNENKRTIKFKNKISSLKELASHSESFLSAISFQNTLKSLVNYSLFQPIDDLKYPKENLILGQLVPVGTGFKEKVNNGETR